jgi:hypothetical protein
MAATKRKSTNTLAGKSEKKTKYSTGSPVAAAPKKILFGKVLEDNGDHDDEDYDDDELRPEPIRDDDETHSMDVDEPDSAPQKKKIRM